MGLARNIITTLSARILGLAIGLISSVLLARVLGPEGRGIFALVLLIPEMAISFGLLGFEQSNVVFAGLEPERRKSLVWQSMVIAGIIGGFIAIAGSLFLTLGAPGLGYLIRGPLWLYLVPFSIVPGRLVVEYWGAILRGMNRIFLLNLTEVGTKIASLFLILILVVGLRFGVGGAVWSEWIIGAGTVILLMVFLKRHGVWGESGLDWSLFKRSGRFALPAHCGTVLSFLNYRVDQFIIAAFLPPEQLGFYIIAVSLVERIWILPGSIANALLPHLTNSTSYDSTLSAVIVRHTIIWIGSICLLVFCFAEVVVSILYSQAFLGAVAPLRWLLPGIFSLSAGKVIGAELLAKKKIDFVVWTGSLVVAVNIVGNLMLVPRMGISGAALASSISYSLLGVILALYYLKQTGLPWTAFILRLEDFQTYRILWHRRSSILF
jgi:O-antigen/teichoic acid export membrane protein